MELSVFSLSAMLIFISIIVLFFLNKRKAKRCPPAYSGGLPIIGHSLTILMYGRDIWTFLKKLMDSTLRNGEDICTFKWGYFTTHVLLNPDECLKASNIYLEKHPGYKFSKLWLGEGLLTGRVSIWRHHRKLLHPSMNQQVLSEYLGVFNNELKFILDFFEENVGKGPFDHSKCIQKATLFSVFSTTMGFKSSKNSSHHSEYLENAQILLHSMMERIVKFWLHNDVIFNWSKLKRRQYNTLYKINKLTDQIITEKEMKMQNKINATSGSNEREFKCYIEHLIELKMNKCLTSEELKDEVHTIIETGYETVSTTIITFLTILGSHADVQDKIYNELQGIFDGVDRDITKEDLSKMKYLEVVIKEMLRLYPTVPVVLRYIDEDIDIGDYTLKAGEDFMIPIYALNRRPEWGPDAELFRPERWFDTSSLPPKTFVNASFSIGRRNCFGIAYAMMYMKTAMAHILRRYKISSDITKVKYELSITLAPISGHHISVEKREETF